MNEHIKQILKYFLIIVLTIVPFLVVFTLSKLRTRTIYHEAVTSDSNLCSK